nr:T9SS type A sorting domain-containing protein [Bacteroidota bacterium]
MKKKKLNIAIYCVIVAALAVKTTYAMDKEPDATQWETLPSIAQQTVLSGGEGVYYSRAMFDIEHEDQMPQLRKYFAHAKNIEKEYSIVVLPNPAKNSLILSLDFAKYTNPTYTVINTIGQNLLSDKIETDKTKINISNPSAGVYYLKVIDAGMIVKGIKIVVIK